MNPYEVLNIHRDASTLEVRAAYRRRAFATHPDRGGSTAEFEAVSRAHEVLTDPERRAKYDATGELDPGSADNVIGELLTGLSQIFNHAITALLSQMREPDTADLLAEMHRVLAEVKMNAERQVDNLEKGQKRLEKLRGCFTVPEGKPNHLETILHQQMVDLDRHLRPARDAVEKLRAVKLYLDGCQYKYDDGGLGMMKFISLNDIDLSGGFTAT